MLICVNLALLCFRHHWSLPCCYDLSLWSLKYSFNMNFILSFQSINSTPRSLLIQFLWPPAMHWEKTRTMAMSIWSSILSIANHTLVILIWRCNFPLNDNNRTPQLSLLVISNSKDNCWKGHQFQNNQHTLVQCCPCFRQQVPLKRAPGVSPSVIVVLVSDNSWPIIKLCRNKIFPNGAQGHYFKGGVRADQSENSRSFNHQIFH